MLWTVRLRATRYEFADNVAVHVEKSELGQAYAAETGFLLQSDPDTVRAPDFAFVSQDRLGEFADYPSYLPVIPDLVAEVVSPKDRANEVESKAQFWLDAGVRMVLVVDPRTAVVRVHRPNSQPQSFSVGLVDLTDVLPGFQLDVAELFA